MCFLSMTVRPARYAPPLLLCRVQARCVRRGSCCLVAMNICTNFHHYIEFVILAVNVKNTRASVARRCRSGASATTCNHA
jgi:hypothetical protein